VPRDRRRARSDVVTDRAGRGRAHRARPARRPGACDRAGRSRAPRMAGRRAGLRGARAAVPCAAPARTRRRVRVRAAAVPLGDPIAGRR
jgi:hypothetical protein